MLNVRSTFRQVVILGDLPNERLAEILKQSVERTDSERQEENQSGEEELRSGLAELHRTHGDEWLGVERGIHVPPGYTHESAALFLRLVQEDLERHEAEQAIKQGHPTNAVD